MLTRTLKLLGIFVILLHFLGVTQYASSYAKNKSSFLSMMTMAEEENKKEKDDKDVLGEDSKDFKDKNLFTLPYENITGDQLIHRLAHENFGHQYVAEQLTPPPNSFG